MPGRSGWMKAGLKRSTRISAGQGSTCGVMIENQSLTEKNNLVRRTWFLED